MRVWNHRIPERRVVAGQAIQRSDKVCWTLVVKQCAGQAQLVRAIMAGATGSDCIIVAELGRQNRTPSCEYVATFADTAGVQMRRVLRVRILYTAIVASKTSARSHYGVGVIKVVDRPRLAADCMTCGASGGRLNVRCGLARCNGSVVAIEAGGDNLCVIYSGR